ncbi:hypothetical protein D3C86_1489570 [compost metagenome]
MLAVPAQHCAHPGFQFVGAKRFADVVVGAGIQGLDDIIFAVSAGEHDRGRWCVHVFTAPTQHLQAGEIRELPIEDQQVECFPAQLSQQVFPALETVQRPGLLAGVRHLLQGLFDPAQFGGLIVQYRNTHTRWFLYQAVKGSGRHRTASAMILGSTSADRRSMKPFTLPCPYSHE